MKIIIATFLIASVESKAFLKEPRFTFLANRELPRYNDGTLDYSYMTKNRGNQANYNKVNEEQNREEEKNEEEKKENNAGSVGNNSQSGSFGPNSGNMSNNTNSNNTTTNNYHGPKEGSKDDVPLGAMQAPSPTNVNSRTDASHHKGDTSTFVTNNFYNPSNKSEGELTVGGQLEYEYLWKRIYDIDSKLGELNPITKGDQNVPLKRKGLIITFDPESNPNNKTLSVESDGIPDYL